MAKQMGDDSCVDLEVINSSSLVQHCPNEDFEILDAVEESMIDCGRHVPMHVTTGLSISPTLAPSALPPGADMQAAESETVVQKGEFPRVVLFGTAGSGKSSLINLLTDNEAGMITASRAVGVTFEFKEYVDRKHGVTLVDTAGLNEVKGGTIDAQHSVNQLVRFLVTTAAEGVGMFVMVKARGAGRIGKLDQQNYELFVECIGQGKVPCLLVLTGCEHDYPDMKRCVDEEAKTMYKSAKMNFDWFVAGSAFYQPDSPWNEMLEAPRRATKEAVWVAIKALLPKDGPVKLFEDIDVGQEFFKLAYRDWKEFCQKARETLPPAFFVCLKRSAAFLSGVAKTLVGMTDRNDDHTYVHATASPRHHDGAKNANKRNSAADTERKRNAQGRPEHGEISVRRGSCTALQQGSATKPSRPAPPRPSLPDVQQMVLNSDPTDRTLLDLAGGP